MEYEFVREIFNLCANNQMRDVFFEEVEIEDTDAYVRDFFPDQVIEIEKFVKENGEIHYDVNASGLRQRFTFTPV